MPTIKVRRGTNTLVPMLAAGEPAMNTQTGRLYMGTGIGNFMYYCSNEIPFRLVPTILANGDNTFKKATFNSDIIDPSVMKTATPIDFRCGYPTAPNDRLGGGAFASGMDTRAVGTYSFAANAYSVSNGTASVALGYGTNAGGYASFTAGMGTKAETYALTSLGSYNLPSAGSDINPSGTQNALVIGNGYADTSRSNCFRVRFDGAVYGVGAYNTSGADYAEYFEWEDGNPKEEDRVGLFVALVGDKIRVAGKGDEILGVISATASVIGNSQSESWSEKYLKDDFGRTLYDIELVEETEIKKPKINPDYNPSLEYEAREDRKEWDPVGLLGRLRVVDDGSCQAGDKCGCGENGVAVKATDGFKVLKRISKNVIEILIK